LGSLGREGVEGAGDLDPDRLVVAIHLFEIGGCFARDRFGAVVPAALRARGEQGERAGRGSLGCGRVPELDPEVDRRLADIGARLRQDEIEELERGVGLGVGSPRQSPEERGCGCGIAVEEALRQRPLRELEAPLRRDRDLSGHRGRGSPPGRGRQRRREPVFDLLGERGDPGRDQPASSGRVAPDERLPVRQEADPRRRHGVSLEDPEAVVVSLRGPAGGLDGRALDEPGGEAARRERSRRGLADPLAREGSARSQSEGQRPVDHTGADRQLGDEGDAGARPGAAEAATAAERHAPGDDDERRRIGGEQPREDAPADLPLLVTDRERRGELVQRGACCGGREPVEVVGEACLERGPHAREQRVRVKPLERAGPVFARGARENRHRLPPRRPPIGAGQVVQLEKAARIESGVSHPACSVAARSASGKLPGGGVRAGQARLAPANRGHRASSRHPGRYGAKILFENVSVQLDPGKRYGVTGANGAGKSTLLEMLARQEDWDAGAIDIQASLKIGVLEQNHFAYDEQRILDAVMAGKADLWAAMVEKEKLLAGEVDDEIGVRLGELEGVIAEHDGYMAEGEAAELLVGLGIPVERHGDSMRSLSAGYKLRVLIAKVLFGRPDVMLLDEPTNHLDLESIQWLSRFLVEQHKGTLLGVSRDRHFLNSVATHVADVDFRTITIYTGNYAEFVGAKYENQQRGEATAQSAKKKIGELEDFVRRFGSHASKSKQAQSRLKQIEKLEEVVETKGAKRSSLVRPFVRFEFDKPSGRDVLRIAGVRKAFAE